MILTFIIELMDNLPYDMIGQIVIHCDSITILMLRLINLRYHTLLLLQRPLFENVIQNDLFIYMITELKWKVPIKFSKKLFSQVALHGNLTNMKWLKEHKCPWDGRTMTNARSHGSRDNINWLNENSCPLGRKVFDRIQSCQDSHNMTWLKKYGYLQNERTFSHAVYFGNIDIMKLLKDMGCIWNERTFARASQRGFLYVMKWLKENGCPWDKRTVANAIIRANEDRNISIWDHTLWLIENGCPH